MTVPKTSDTENIGSINEHKRLLNRREHGNTEENEQRNSRNPSQAERLLL